MAELKIFIAGSKVLKQERNSIKIVANDLSSLYSSKGIHITAHSYEHFDEDQKSYNDFIVNEADIVAFIIDGYIGSKTEEEFVAAARSFRDDKRPDVMIFMREYDAKSITSDIARVQGLIMGSLGSGKYHVDYTSLDDLKTLAKERIIRYIEKHADSLMQRPKSKDTMLAGEATNASSVARTAGEPLKLSWKRKLFGAFIALIVLVCAFLCGRRSSVSAPVQEKGMQPYLVFSGGGSVVDYIKNNTEDSLDIKMYENSIYINLASGSAWNLLLEEAVRWNEQKVQPFVSVVLSADRIDTAQINHKVHNIGSLACITGYFLGHDTLAVYVEKDFAMSRGLSTASGGTGKLSDKEFVSLLSYAKKNPEEVRLFTTSASSGTLRMYQRVTDKLSSTINFEKMLADRSSHLFFQATSSDYLYMLNNESRRPYIILGSENYLPYKANNYCKFHIYADDEAQKKEMYIYFMAYKNFDDDEYYFSPKVLELLKELGAEKVLPGDVWSFLSQCRLPGRYGHTILYLND